MAVLATIRMKFKEMTWMQQETSPISIVPANVINMSITQLATATGSKVSPQLSVSIVLWDSQGITTLR